MDQGHAGSRRQLTRFDRSDVHNRFGVKTRRDLTRDFQRLPSEVTRYEEPVTRATMRVAVLADVHGNRLALNAILIDLERRGGVKFARSGRERRWSASRRSVP